MLCQGSCYSFSFCLISCLYKNAGMVCHSYLYSFLILDRSCVRIVRVCSYYVKYCSFPCTSQKRFVKYRKHCPSSESFAWVIIFSPALPRNIRHSGNLMGTIVAVIHVNSPFPKNVFYIEYGKNNSWCMSYFMMPDDDLRNLLLQK